MLNRYGDNALAETWSADEFALPMIRTARRHGAGSRMLSFSSLTSSHPARCTDRGSGFIGTTVARCDDARAATANACLAQPPAAVGDRKHLGAIRRSRPIADAVNGSLHSGLGV